MRNRLTHIAKRGSTLFDVLTVGFDPLNIDEYLVFKEGTLCIPLP